MTRPDITGMKRLSAHVRGMVQGVGFRASTAREARRLGASGWVRNCEDGSVEVLAEGPEERLRELETALRRGPAGAHVESVETEWSPATGEFRGFNIRY